MIKKIGYYILHVFMFVWFTFVCMRAFAEPLDKNVFILEGVITNNTLIDFLKFTENFKKGVYIGILINSPGGYMTPGEQIIKIMENYKTICVAHRAESMAFITLLNCNFAIAHNDSVLMWHEVTMELQGTYSRYDLRDGADSLDRSINKFNSIIVDKTKYTLDIIQKNTYKKDWFITPKEALENGVVDEIVERKI